MCSHQLHPPNLPLQPQQSITPMSPAPPPLLPPACRLGWYSNPPQNPLAWLYCHSVKSPIHPIMHRTKLHASTKLHAPCHPQSPLPLTSWPHICIIVACSPPAVSPASWGGTVLGCGGQGAWWATVCLVSCRPPPAKARLDNLNGSALESPCKQAKP